MQPVYLLHTLNIGSSVYLIMDKLKELQIAIRTDNKVEVDEIKGDCSGFISRAVKPEELDSLREDTLASVLIPQSSVDRAKG